MNHATPSICVHRPILFSLLLLLSFVCPSPGFAQQAASSEATSSETTRRPTTFWPDDVEFDEAIPTPEEHFGFDIGHRHLSHAQVVSYFELLAESSDRFSLEQYGRTHGQRPLLLLTVTSAANRNRLDEIRNEHRKLTGPNAADVDISKLPAVINMGYGVHGDEPSATNCAPLIAYYLAAARGEEIESWLENCVILIDPSLNPDGFNRFANWVNRYRGVVPNPDPQHAEHNQMWPPGRVNYYWFDLNRDWLPLVHPESRSRMSWYHAWKPDVVLDFHEMGTNSTFFFQPGIPERTNPLTPARNLELTGQIARFHSKALDERGSLYFTKERFDDFYMGKGSTYPDLHGAIGILFEQASSRGHVQLNQDGLLTFHDTIANQFTTSRTSLAATTALREDLLRYKREFYRDALEMARGQSTRSFVFSCPYNRTRVRRFADVLIRHDIECYWLKEDLNDGKRKFDARWTLVVPTEQPEYRFLKSLLMRKKNFKENIFYDVSAWTLPLAYGITESRMETGIDSEKLQRAELSDRVTTESESDVAGVDPAFQISDEDVAWMIDWRDDAATALLARLLEAEIKVRVALRPLQSVTSSPDADPEVEPTTASFGRGTLSVVPGIQTDKREMIERLLRAGAEQGVVITAVRSGFSEGGIDLGSPNFPVLENPKVAMIVGPRVSAYGAGEIWHLLDERLQIPVTLLMSSGFARADLSEYNTLIIPAGSYEDEIWNATTAFADRGGTVIITGSAAVTAAERLKPNGDSSSLSTSLSTANQNPEVRSSNEDRSSTNQNNANQNAADDGPVQQAFETASDTRALQLISGAIFKTQIDVTHPLLFGVPDRPLAVFRDHAQMLEPSTNPYANPVIYDREKPLMAGYCSDENIEKLRSSASVVVMPSGRGRLILMADNPNFRGFWEGTNRVFLNALFFGSFVDP